MKTYRVDPRLHRVFYVTTSFQARALRLPLGFVALSSMRLILRTIFNKVLHGLVHGRQMTHAKGA